MSIDNISLILAKKCRERKSIRLKQEYLKGWLESQPSSVESVNTERLYDALIEDVLNKDIGLTSEAVIPSNFGQSAVDNFPNGAVRRGGVVLQLQDTMDISHSAFSLLNKIKNTAPVRQVYVERNEEDGVDLPRGILRWTLSDGTTQLQALEIETIPSLDLKTPFGCKILVKSCQVRRGMLLLKRESVEVLGGCVPELYKGHMMLELEYRLKQKLGLAEQPATPVPETQPRQASMAHANTDDMDMFDDDEDALIYSQLDNLTGANDNMDIDASSRPPTTNTATANTDTTDTTDYSAFNTFTQRSTAMPSSTHEFDSMFSDDDDFMPAAAVPRSPAKPTPSPNKVTPSKRKGFATASSTTTTATATATATTFATTNSSNIIPTTSTASEHQSSTIPLSQANPRKRAHVIERTAATVEKTQSATATLTNRLNRQDSASNEESSVDLSWIDPSVWENIDKVKKEKGDEDAEKDRRYSFQELSETLKAMEDENFNGNLPDTVTVRAMCVKFGKMTMSSAKGFYLEIEFIDPSNKTSKPICVIFNNEMITRLVGHSKEEIKEMTDRIGSRQVVKKVFKPFQDQLLKKIAMLTVDLSVLSEASGQSYNRLLPLAIGFDTCM